MINFSIFILCLSLLIWEHVRTTCCNTQTCYIFFSHLYFTIIVSRVQTKILKEIQNQIPSWRLILFIGSNHTSSREAWTSDHQMKPLVLRIWITKCNQTQTSEWVVWTIRETSARFEMHIFQNQSAIFYKTLIEATWHDLHLVWFLRKGPNSADDWLHLHVRESCLEILSVSIYFPNSLKISDLRKYHTCSNDCITSLFLIFCFQIRLTWFVRCSFQTKHKHPSL